MSQTTRHKLLFIEEDPEVRTAISKILVNGGFEVLEAKSGEEARKSYDDPSFYSDAIVSSLGEKGFSGDDFAVHNSKNRKLPFVAFSAFSDVKLGLKLAESGVYSYVVKPVKPDTFPTVVSNAIKASELIKEAPEDKNRHSGNTGFLTVSSNLGELGRVNSWVVSKIKGILPPDKAAQFLNFLGELLLNAHEHGNLHIGEELKSKLLDQDNFDIELGLRENVCTKKIRVSICVLKDSAAVAIEDEGDGFNYKKYMEMTEDDVVNRIQMLNGRGIFLVRQYFDSVEYFKNGSKVVVTKNF